MGKSMLIREIFTLLAKQHRKQSGHTPVPVAINLRDHWGQNDPHEVLTRHARKIGFVESTQLVRAYNAGHILLLVDGFDEIVGTPVASRRELKRLRFEALAVIRLFVSDVRGKSGLLVTGRQNFFDTDREREHALGVRPADPVFELAEFSSEEAEELLKHFEIKGQMPPWLPRRPLFLAYLASHGLLSDLTLERDLSPAEAWHRLIEAICSREKKINEHLEASAIRDILGALADLARQTETGRGPLYPSDIIQAYAWATGYDEPDEHIRPLLMRLPGLTSRSSEDGAREFLDDSMLNALRAPCLEAFFRDSYERDPHARNWKHGISDLGLDVTVHRLRDSESVESKSIVAARQAVNRWECPTLAADLIRLGQRSVPEGEQLQCSLQVTGGVFEELDLSEVACSGLTVNSCEIKLLVVPGEPPVGLEIQDSIIDRIQGIAKEELLPQWIRRCEVGEFDSFPTNASILDDTQLPIAHRVLLTILRKLYLQRGAGRRENALSRGLPNTFKNLALPILEVMRSQGWVYKQVLRGNRIWYPERSRTSEVHTILNNYAGSRHPLVLEVRSLSKG